VVDSGNQVLERRRKAAAARGDHRVRSVATLMDDINSARQSLFGTLTKLAADNRLSRNWADRFFRHGSREPETNVPPTPPAPPSAA
jgi:hypothetical protein